jgi:hypothetical protein
MRNIAARRLFVVIYAVLRQPTARKHVRCSERANLFLSPYQVRLWRGILFFP